LYAAAVRGATVVVVVIGALALGACSAGPKDNATHTPTTTAPTIPAPSSTTAAPSTSAGQPTSNLVVTDAVRAQLVAAGASLNELSAADYTGLRPGETYYAYDAATTTYWAAAGLQPSPTSTPAQVATQDDGAYLLFERPARGQWKGYDVGLAGARYGGKCPIAVPATVLVLWTWAPGSCRPAVIG
jgi:hypothetical protein